MKKILIAASISVIASAALAETPTTSAHHVSGTATIVSDYVFRGVSQSWHRPAIQGSIDYAHASGIFATVWASTLSEKIVAGADVEVDFVLGFKRSFNDRLSYGASIVSVVYPGGNVNKVRWGENPDKRYNFNEAAVFVSYQAVSLKYSRTLTDLFGWNQGTGFSRSTKGSTYLELNADIPLLQSGFTLGLHAGHQDVKANFLDIDPDWNDYRVSLSRAFPGGWSAAVQVTENSNKAFYDNASSTLAENDRRDIGKRRYAVSFTKLF